MCDAENLSRDLTCIYLVVFGRYSGVEIIDIKIDILSVPSRGTET